VDDDDDGTQGEPFDLLAAVRRNRERLEQRFAAARQRGQRWLAECRDLGDAYDSAAGVYFVECADDLALEQVVALRRLQGPVSVSPGIGGIAAASC
jgi:hypothetical protein